MVLDHRQGRSGRLGHLGGLCRKSTDIIIAHDIAQPTCADWYRLCYKMSRLDACWSSQVSYSFSSLYYQSIIFTRNIMIFASLALLSGMVLFSNAAPGNSTPTSGNPPSAMVTHLVNVSNDTAGLLYDPPYIVSQPNSHSIPTLVLICFNVLDCSAWRHHFVQVPSQEPHCNPVQL